VLEEPAKSDSPDDRRLHHRRGSARANAPWPVTIISGSKTLEGRVQNISQGGVLVYLKENLAVHETIRIAVEIPDCSNVLTAEGEVIRATALDNIVDNQYACSAAIQFTNISPQDLKYFSGNLAPGWHRANSAPEQFSQSVQPDNPQDTKSNKSLFLAGSVLCGVLLLFFLINGNNDGKEISEQITSIDKKYSELQTQLTLLQDSENKLQRIEEEIQRMDIQLNDFQEKLTSLALVMEKAGEQRRDTANELPETESSITVLSNNPPSSKIVTQEPDYYEVQKGETLYRISVKHNTTVSGLRKLNNLDIDDRIYPGQKLRIN
jgi:LysM repeat protein